MSRIRQSRVGKRLRWAVVLAAMGFAVLAAPGTGAEPAPYIAGVQPDQRPQGAPTITAYDKSGDWLARAARGVEQPHPPSLKFLQDQGAWYTPFTRPGMPGRYDIRHMHQPMGGKAHSAGK